MIKLPIELESRENWLDVLALTDATPRRPGTRLCRAWQPKSGRYIRPIALIQAQPRSKPPLKRTPSRSSRRRSWIEHSAFRQEDGQDHDELEKIGHARTADEVARCATSSPWRSSREGWDCPSPTSWGRSVTSRRKRRWNNCWAACCACRTRSRRMFPNWTEPTRSWRALTW